MINPKSLIISAAAGFVLSFLIGFISGNAFLTVLWRALVVSLIFAVISVCITFLYKKFLSEQDTSLGGNVSENAGAPHAGGIVNVSVSDENLDDDSQGPNFVVTGDEIQSFEKKEHNEHNEYNEKKENSEDFQESQVIQNNSVQENTDGETPEISAKENVPPPVKPVSENSSAEFVPINLGEKTSGQAEEREKNAPMTEVDPSQLDELPDIGDISFERKNGEVGDIIDDSDFASEGDTPRGPSSYSESSLPNTQDTDVIASAVRTLLARDNQ